MLLAIDNQITGILIKVWKVPAAADYLEIIKLLADMDNYTERNTENMLLHQYIMTKKTSLVVTYIEYSYFDLFEPLQIQVAIKGFTNR